LEASHLLHIFQVFRSIFKIFIHHEKYTLFATQEAVIVVKY